MLSVVFFRTLAGNEPVLDWLREQAPETRLRIGEDLRTVQLGWPMGMPLVRSLGDGLYEVRTDIPNGIARLVFFQNMQTLVIVEEFIKKSRKTPKTELDNARKRKSEYESHLRAQRKRSGRPAPRPR